MDFHDNECLTSQCHNNKDPNKTATCHDLCLSNFPTIPFVMVYGYIPTTELVTSTSTMKRSFFAAVQNILIAFRLNRSNHGLVLHVIKN